MKDRNNIYYRARMDAAADDPLFSSRERTAGEIFVSQEALFDYETGRTVPPCDAVQKMIEAYGAPDLRRAHIRACCPLIADYGGSKDSTLAQAALKMALALCEKHQAPESVAMRFARVAQDGIISADEVEEARLVRRTADIIRRAMEGAIIAIDRALAAGREGEKE